MEVKRYDIMLVEWEGAPAYKPVETPNGIYVIWGAHAEKVAALERELAEVDEALARRPAIADFPTRREKIEVACSAASRGEKAKRALTACQARLARLREVVRLYGRHLPECVPFDPPSFRENADKCTCGFSNAKIAALAEEPKEGEGP